MEDTGRTTKGQRSPGKVQKVGIQCSHWSSDLLNCGKKSIFLTYDAKIA